MPSQCIWNISKMKLNIQKWIIIQIADYIFVWLEVLFLFLKGDFHFFYLKGPPFEQGVHF